MSSSRNAILVTAVCALVEQAHADCTVPSPPTGYIIGDTTGQNLDPSSFVSPSVTCDIDTWPSHGSTGTGPTAVACSSDNSDYTFEGCTTDCIAPAAGTTGYVVAGSLAYDTWSPTVTCDSGYHSTGGGGPSIVPCSEAGREYTPMGCAVDECVRPSSGYTSIDFSNVGETDLTATGISVTGLACAAGYAGTVGAVTCTMGDGSFYDIDDAGCTQLTCTGYADDAAMPTGYVQGSSYAETLDGPNFAVADVECAAGYTGTPQAAICTSNNSGYVLSGCTAAESNSFAGVSAGSQVALLVGALMSAVLAF